jgi:hypothetical protein
MSFTNKTARNYITEILLKVALKAHTPNPLLGEGEIELRFVQDFASSGVFIVLYRAFSSFLLSTAVHYLMTSHHIISSIIKYTRNHHKAYILSLNFD